MKLTIGISTWNRAALLDKTLAEMIHLRIPEGVTWEILVVNNNSTDNTDEVIARYAEKLPIRGLFEPRQGKSNACNMLIREASGELILWTDDDVLVDREWLASYHQAAVTWPDAAYFGGTIDPLYEVDPPAWVHKSLSLIECVFALRPLGSDVHVLKADEFPFGANMAFRPSRCGPLEFNPSLGPMGGQLVRGEEMDVLVKLKARALQGIWVGPARVRHWVPKERMTFKYLWDWFYQAGVVEARDDRKPGPRIFGMPRWILRQWISDMASWTKAAVMGDDPGRVKAWLDWAMKSGMLAECRRQSR